MKRVYILYLLGFVVLVFITWFIYIWFKPFPETNQLNTSKSFSVSELISKVNEKDISKLKPFIEKAIEVNGVLKKITYKNNRYSLLLEGEKTDVLVLCEMEKQQGVSELTIGDKIIVKGIFKGVLHDAVLLNCILIGKKSYE